MNSATESWFRLLRNQLVEVARRRVPEEDVEDVVQDALRVIHERGDSLPTERQVDGRPPVAWCFQVLRFTISNLYRRQRTRRSSLDPRVDPDTVSAVTPAGTALESLESEEALELIEAALDQLASDDVQCGRYLDRLLDGIAPRELAKREGLDEPILYRRVYRCRQKLRALLARKGIRS